GIRGGAGIDRHHASIGVRCELAENRVGQAALFANVLEQPRRHAAPQQIIEDSETEAVLVIKRNRRNPDANMRLLEIALFFEQDGRLRVGRAAIVGSLGRPSECPGQKPRVKISWRRYSGLSRSILISSRTTLRSFFTSSESNFGRRTRSAITSKAMGRCSSSTLALKQICSLEVKASSM